jgi:hypothetical protein
MAKVWNAPGSVTAIVRDLSRTGHFFVALDTSINAGAGRIFEIHSDAPLHFTGQDITANLPMALVMTLAYNRFEPDVLYAGTKGRGVFRGMQRRRPLDLAGLQQRDAGRCDRDEAQGELGLRHDLRGHLWPGRLCAGHGVDLLRLSLVWNTGVKRTRRDMQQMSAIGRF